MCIGLFGGTFDPPHVGHLIVARDVLETLGLSEVRFVVSARPPHKPEGPGASPELRLAMVEAAIGGEPGLRAEACELRRSGPSYTVDTLRQLRAAEPEASWALLLGVDQLVALHTWREPEELPRLARLVVMAREGTVAEDVEGNVDVACEAVSVTRVDVSSSGVRKRLASGRSARFLVADPVLDIIETNGLYRD